MTVIQFPEVDGRPLGVRISEEVRALMGRYDVSQTDLAEWIGVNQTAISARLAGRTAWKIEDIEAVAQAFGRHPAELMGGYPASGPSGPGAGPVPIKRDQALGGYLDAFSRRRLTNGGVAA